MEFAIGVLLLGAAIQDFRTHLISNWFSLIIMILGLFINGPISLLKAMIMLVFLLIACTVEEKMFKGRSMGGGDVKLCSALAMAIGLGESFCILLVALLGLMILGYWSYSERLNVALPLAPFLFVSYVIYSFL